MMSNRTVSEYTRQELWELVKPALEDEIAGRVLTHEQVFGKWREHFTGVV